MFLLFLMPLMIMSLLLPCIPCAATIDHAVTSGNDPESRFTVTVDPRIELLSIVQYLSHYEGFNGNPVLTKLDFPYRTEAIEFFTPYRDHEAVRLFDEMSGQGFWYGQPPEVMLSLTDPPELKQVFPISDFVIRRAGGKERLDEFIRQLRLFANNSGFMDFYRYHRDTYDAMTAGYFENIEDWSYVNDMDEYYGYRQNSYTVILAPFFHTGGFGPRVAAGDGLFDVYNICGPWDVVDKLPFFGNNDFFKRIVWHEFSHSYVNHLTDRHIDRLVGHCDALQQDMKKKIEAMPNVTWDVYVHEWISEHIVRAVTTRLATLKLGSEAGNVALQKEEKQGYDYVRQLCEKLEVYENMRDRYTTFPEFFPELVDVFRTLADEAGK